MQRLIVAIAVCSWLSGFCTYSIGFEQLSDFDSLPPLESCKNLATSGDPIDQTRYGVFLYKEAEQKVWQGEKKEKYIDAAKWLKLAADQSAPVANYYLGYAYYMGHGVPKDCDKSIKCFKRAAKGGLSQAGRCLTYFYLEKDRLEALKWLLIAQELKPNDANTLYWLDVLDTEMPAEQLEQGKKASKEWLESYNQSKRAVIEGR